MTLNPGNPLRPGGTSPPPGRLTTAPVTEGNAMIATQVTRAGRGAAAPEDAVWLPRPITRAGHIWLVNPQVSTPGKHPRGTR